MSISSQRSPDTFCRLLLICSHHAAHVVHLFVHHLFHLLVFLHLLYHFFLFFQGVRVGVAHADEISKDSTNDSNYQEHVKDLNLNCGVPLTSSFLATSLDLSLLVEVQEIDHVPNGEQNGREDYQNASYPQASSGSLLIGNKEVDSEETCYNCWDQAQTGEHHIPPVDVVVQQHEENLRESEYRQQHYDQSDEVDTARDWAAATASETLEVLV